MKSLDEIQKLVRNADAIQKAMYDWENVYLADLSCDKKAFGFNNDERFAACEPLMLRVDSWKGYYGNSGCSNILHVDKDIFNRHLLKVLRGKFWSLMKETEASIREEARTHKETAKEELAKQLEAINNL